MNEARSISTPSDKLGDASVLVRRDDLNAARCLVYQWLSASLMVADPVSRARLQDSAFQERCAAAGEYLSRAVEDPGDGIAPGELPVKEFSLESMVEGVRCEFDLVQQGFERVFGLLMPSECPPFETEYCPQTFSVFRSQQMADIAGYYRAFGLTPGEIQCRRVDSLSMELEFMAWLVFKEEASYACSNSGVNEAATCAAAQHSFFRDHLSWWLPAFARGLYFRSGTPLAESDPSSESEIYYRTLASMLASFTACERSVLRIPRPQAAAAPQRVEEGDCDSCEAACDDLIPLSGSGYTPMPRTPYAC